MGDVEGGNLSAGEGSKERTVELRVRMRGCIADRFLRIKEAKGLLGSAEVVRLLINEYFEKNLARRADCLAMRGFERSSATGSGNYSGLSSSISPSADRNPGPDLNSDAGSGKGIAPEDREFVREELAWIAEWIRRRYPRLMFPDIRSLMADILLVSV